MLYSNNREAFIGGVRALLPIVPGVIPFGLITGVTATEQGFSFLKTLGMTLLFFAGSAQIVVLQLLREDTFALVILLTALIINLRFMMYSASLAPYLHQLPLRFRGPLSYMLSDQAYALSIVKLSSSLPGSLGHSFFAGSAFNMWLSWNLSVVAGALLGSGIPEAWSLEFAIPLTFLALLIPAIKSSSHLSAACVAGLVATLAIDLPYNLGLLLAGFCGIFCGVALENLHQSSEAN